MDSLSSIIQTLMKTDKDFPNKLKQRLVLESSFLRNPFKFIVGLFKEGVLSDGSNDPEASFGLKEMIVQLVMMIVCSKGSDGISGLVKAMDGSGNLLLIARLWTWVKKDYDIEAYCHLIDKKQGASAMPTATPEEMPKDMKSATEMNSSGTKLIESIMSHVDEKMIGKFEGYLAGKASNILNIPEFCSHLVHQSILEKNDFQLATTPKAQRRQWAVKAIKAACSKKAIGSLVIALQHSGNERILEETLEWLGTSSTRRKNNPIAVTAGQSIHQSDRHQQKPLNSKLVEHVPPANGIKKVATLNYQLESSMKGTFALELDQFKMITRHTDGTVKRFSWQDNKETAVRFGVQVKNITWFQYDEEIIVLGTSEGTVYLFDVETLEEKWTIRLGDPVYALKFVESTLVVVTRSGDIEKFWWIDISRPDMRLLNQRTVESWINNNKTVFFVDSNYSFLYVSGWLRVYSTKSGKWIQDCNGLGCYLDAPANISAFSVVDLMTTKTNFIAGYEKGHIDMWGSSKFKNQQRPIKTLRGHQTAVVSVCALSGHLLSLDQSGKLLMWSGYDLENKNVDAPVPRVLAEDWYNVTSLVAYGRWFASVPNVLVQGSCNGESLISYKRWFGSSSSEDANVNIWTLPDLWLRTG